MEDCGFQVKKEAKVGNESNGSKEEARRGG